MKFHAILAKCFPFLFGEVRTCRSCGRVQERKFMYYGTGYGWFCTKEEADAYWIPLDRWPTKPK